MSSEEKVRDPIEAWLGPNIAKTYYEGAPDTTDVSLPPDQLEEIKAFIVAHKDAWGVPANKGRLTYKGSKVEYDICMVKSLQKSENMKMRKLNRGTMTMGFAYDYAPTGFLGVGSNVSGIFNDVEPNTLYFVVGKFKLSAATAEKPEYHNLNRCRAIIKMGV